MTLKAATICLTATLGIVAGILLDREEPSPAEQLACREAGGISLVSSTGAPLCIRRDALLNPHLNLQTRAGSPHCPSQI